MTELRRELDLAQEALPADRGGDVVAPHFDGDITIVLEIVREVDHRCCGVRGRKCCPCWIVSRVRQARKSCGHTPCRETNPATGIPTHFHGRLPVKSEVLAGAGGGFSVCVARVYRGKGCGNVGDGHPGAGSGRVQRDVSDVTDEAVDAGGAAAECDGRAGQPPASAGTSATLKSSPALLRRRRTTSLNRSYEPQRCFSSG